MSIAPEMAGRAVKIRNAYQRCNCYSWNLKLMLIRWRKGEAGAEALAFMTLRSVLGLASYQPLASPSGNPRMMSRLTGDGNDFAPAERAKTIPGSANPDRSCFGTLLSRWSDKINECRGESQAVDILRAASGDLSALIKH